MDSLNVATAMTAAGTYDWKRDGRPPMVPEKLFMAVENFQRQQGLKVDGIMNPGGPTQTRLNEVLPARMERPFIMSKRLPPREDDDPSRGKTWAQVWRERREAGLPAIFSTDPHSEGYEGREPPKRPAVPSPQPSRPKSMVMELLDGTYRPMLDPVTLLPLRQDAPAKPSAPSRMPVAPSPGQTPPSRHDKAANLGNFIDQVREVLDDQDQFAQAGPRRGQPGGPSVVQPPRAIRTAVPSRLADAIIGIERPLRPETDMNSQSPRGLGQFDGQTWLRIIYEQRNTLLPPELRNLITPVRRRPGGRGDEVTTYEFVRRDLTDAVLAWRNDPAMVRVVMGIRNEENRRILTEILGREPTYTEIYMTHFLGRTGGPRFIRDALAGLDRPATELAGPTAVRSNRNVFFRGAQPEFEGENLPMQVGEPLRARDVMLMFQRRLERELAALEARHQRDQYRALRR